MRLREIWAKLRGHPRRARLERVRQRTEEVKEHVDRTAAWVAEYRRVQQAMEGDR